MSDTHTDAIEASRPNLDGLIGTNSAMTALSEAVAGSMPNLDGLIGPTSALSAISDAIEASRPNLDGLIGPTSALSAISDAMASLLDGVSARNREIGTPNLAGWSATDLGRAHHIASTEGIPFAWVMRSEIARRLIDAEDAEARRDILLARSSDLLDDIRSAIAGLPDGRERRHLTEAVMTYDHGLHLSAQAHAAAITEAIVCTLGDRGKGHRAIKEQAARPIANAFLREVARLLALSPSLVVFARFFPSDGDPVPAKFNRHASAHTLDDAQWTEINALTGLLYATSLSMEFNRRGTPSDAAA